MFQCGNVAYLLHRITLIAIFKQKVNSNGNKVTRMLHGDAKTYITLTYDHI